MPGTPSLPSYVIPMKARIQRCLVHRSKHRSHITSEYESDNSHYVAMRVGDKLYTRCNEGQNRQKRKHREMLNFATKFVWTSTTLVPVLLVYSALAAVDKELRLAGILAIIACAQVTCFYLIWRYHLRDTESSDFSVTSAKTADRESFGFVILYLLPLFQISIGNIDWLTFAVVVVVFTIVIAAGYHYHFNPILRLMGWHFYNVDTREGITYVMITKKELRSMKKGAGKFTVKQLTEYVVVEVGSATIDP